MAKLICAITGCRPSRFRFKYNENNTDCKRIRRCMEEQFSLLYKKGVHHFIIGGALGVDMWAGEILLTMKEKSEFSEIKLTMALPFEGYDVDWDRASREKKQNSEAGRNIGYRERIWKLKLYKTKSFYGRPCGYYIGGI